MDTFTKKLLSLAVLVSIVVDASADRGFGRKSKSKTILNIHTSANFKNSLTFNLKSGLSYKGSLLSTRKSVASNAMMNTSIVTYSKGNTTYIIPYKNKITVTEVKPGYTGMKIIIRKK